MTKYNPRLKEKARRLRTQKIDRERALWALSGDRGDGSDTPRGFGVAGWESPLTPLFQRGEGRRSAFSRGEKRSLRSQSDNQTIRDLHLDQT